MINGFRVRDSGVELSPTGTDRRGGPRTASNHTVRASSAIAAGSTRWLMRRAKRPLHRSGLDPYTGVIPRMPADQNGDLFWNRGALTPPKSAAGVVNDANNGYLLGNVQSNKAGHR
jgi:hypothetical protein